MLKISYSQLAILFSFVVVGYIILSNAYWREDLKIIENDVLSYYAYLPAVFIHGDVSLDFVNEKDPKIWYHNLDNGNKIIKTTVGVSYFYLPFFIVAHQFATSTDYHANGFSLPYRVAIYLSSVISFVLGLIYLRKYLLNFFSEATIFWTILIVGVGTNIVNYVVREPGMSHVYSFFLSSLFIYNLHEWYNDHRQKSMLLVGLSLALLILVRPINILLLFVFVLYGINSFHKLRLRFQLFLKEYRQLLLAAIVGFIVFIPQLLYWKYITGSWIFYSYIDEGFFFNDPKFIEGLFSYRKGWLLYTPLMTLSLIGLLVPNKELNRYKPGLIFFQIVYLYVTFSWWCWWYGGSFGMRPLIDIYPLLAMPIAIVMDKVFRNPFYIKLTAIVAVVAFIYLNLFQNYQYREGLIHYDAMTKESYWMIWGETELMDGYWESLDYTDAEAAKQGIR